MGTAKRRLWFGNPRLAGAFEIWKIEIGAALCICHHGGVHLMHAGQRFAVGAKKALNQVSQTAVDAGSFGRGERGNVRIGIFSSLACGLLSILLTGALAHDCPPAPRFIRRTKPARTLLGANEN